MAEVPVPLTSFRGVDEKLVIGSDPTKTRSSLNVIYRFGRVIGRPGVNELDGITTASGDQIIKLVEFRRADGTSDLVRLTLTKVEKLVLASDTWSDVTGTDMSSTSTTYVSTTVIDDNLIIANAGLNAVRKLASTGNSADIGGSPPTSNLCIAFEGFLFLGGITIGATLFGRRVRYSDDWDAIWTATDELNFSEVRGNLVNWGILGRTLFLYFTDGAVAVRFVGPPVNFSQERVPFDQGLAAAASLISIDPVGHILLGTDQILYLNDGNAITPLPPNVQETLRDSQSAGWVGFAVGADNRREDEYVLFINKTGGSWLEGTMTYNYRTGDFSLGSYAGNNFTSAVYVRLEEGEIWSEDDEIWSDDDESWLADVTSDTGILVASDTDGLVYRLDKGTDDNGTKVNRFWTSDWQLGNVLGDKYFTGAVLTFKRAPKATVKISMAYDFNDDFIQEKTYGLQGQGPGHGDAVVVFNVTPTLCSVCNIRVRPTHGDQGNPMDLRSVILKYEPVAHVTTEPQPQVGGHRG